MKGYDLYQLLILRLIINFDMTDPRLLHSLIFLAHASLAAPVNDELIPFFRTRDGVRSPIIEQKIKDLEDKGLIDSKLMATKKGRNVYLNLSSALKYSPVLENCIDIYMKLDESKEHVEEAVNSFLPVRRLKPGEQVPMYKIWELNRGER